MNISIALSLSSELNLPFVQQGRLELTCLDKNSCGAYGLDMTFPLVIIVTLPFGKNWQGPILVFVQEPRSIILLCLAVTDHRRLSEVKGKGLVVPNYNKA